MAVRLQLGAIAAVVLTSALACERRSEAPGAEAKAPVAAPPIATADPSAAPPSQAVEAPVAAAPEAGERAAGEEPPAPAPAARAPPTPDLTPPRPPGRLSAQATSDREVALRWEAASDRVGVARYEVLEGEAVVLETTATAARVAGLTPGREVCYAVVARDAAGNRSAPTPRACVTPLDVTPPTEPVAPTAAATSEDAIELRWGEATDDAGVEGYRVRRGDAVVATVREAAAGEGGLRAGTEYCYTVVAYDAAGNASRPAGPACATTLDRTPPTSPGEPVATSTSEDRVDVAWTASEDNVGVVAYELRRTGGPRIRGDALAAGESGLRAFTRYCYTVVALDAAGNRSEPAGPTCARTLDQTPPTPPADVVLRPASPTTLEVRWSPSRDNGEVAGYELVRDGRVVESGVETSTAESQLAPSTEYCYRVRAHDAAGNRSPESGPSCARTLAPLQPAPPRYVVIERTPGALQVAWGPAERADLVYRVYEEGRPIGATRFLKYAVRRPPDGKPHCYSVGAVDEAGRESPRSAEVCAAFQRTTSAARQ